MSALALIEVGKINQMLQFSSAEDLRTKLTLATIASKHITIETPSSRLEEHEVAFAKLICNVSDGTSLTISPTGTKMVFKPGMLRGGDVAFACPLTRGVGYYLEYFILIAMFCKFQLRLTLTGVTNDNYTLSVDTIREVTIPQVAFFCAEKEDLYLDIKSRGFMPGGGGEVILVVRPQDKLKSVDYSKLSIFEEVRGCCVSANLPTALPNRAITAAKGEILKVLANVHMAADYCQKRRSGNSRGFGVSLWAKTYSGALVSADLFTDTVTEDLADPEAMGLFVARVLLREIQYMGAPDLRHQPIILLFMACTIEDVSKCRLGPLTERSVRTLRLINEILGVRFSLEPVTIAFDEDYTSEKEWRSDKAKDVIKTKTLDFVIAMCRGAGIRNISKMGF